MANNGQQQSQQRKATGKRNSDRISEKRQPQSPDLFQTQLPTTSTAGNNGERNNGQQQSSEGVDDLRHVGVNRIAIVNGLLKWVWDLDFLILNQHDPQLTWSAMSGQLFNTSLQVADLMLALFLCSVAQIVCKAMGVAAVD
ncbi:Uncharacterized protein Fot_50966 [Forsythia ovata]|uniref:Uncharacterized protein n=1 Tax=Forsythia ovata TaxID=205694 RepID=A0ABD1PZT4_9LAMI